MYSGANDTGMEQRTHSIVRQFLRHLLRANKELHQIDDVKNNPVSLHEDLSSYDNFLSHDSVPTADDFKALLSKLEHMQGDLESVSKQEDSQSKETHSLSEKLEKSSHSEESLFSEIKAKDVAIEKQVTQDHELLEAAIGKLEHLSETIVDMQINAKHHNIEKDDAKGHELEEELAHTKEDALVHEQEQDQIHKELIEKDKVVQRLQEIIDIEEKLHDLEIVYKEYSLSENYTDDDLMHIREKISLFKNKISELKKSI